MKKNIEEGKLIKQVVVVSENRQSRIGIPEHIMEILGIKKGDKFNWYIKRYEDGMISLRAVYIKNLPAQKKFVGKKAYEKITQKTGSEDRGKK